MLTAAGRSGRSALALAAGTAVLLGIGCSGEAPPAPPAAPAGAPAGRVGPAVPAHGDTLIHASIGDASNLIAILSTDKTSHDVANLIYSGLVKYDGDYQIVGDAAESWEVSADRRTLTFRLREDIRFHDGTPLTAADVAFTYRLIMDPATLTAYRGDFELVARAEALDARTFQVEYRRPFAPALISWSTHILPRHLLAGVDLQRAALARKPVGSGPFRFAEWQGGQHIQLVRNPDYFRYDGESGMRLPYLDRYLLRIIPDQSVQFNELLAGKIDRMFLKPLQWERQTDTQRFAESYNKYEYLRDAYTYLGYNLKNELFSDVKVRRALTHAIDKDEIVAGVLLGHGVPATGPYKPGTWVYNAGVARYPYDPKAAQRLLAEVGWSDSDGDGLLDREGQPFRFTILTNQGNDQRIKTAQIVQQRLRAIGVEVELRVLEWAAFINEFVRPGRFEAVILGWTILPDPDLYDVWHSSRWGPEGLNHTYFANEELDELLVRARETFDRQERKRLYGRVQEILAEEQPYTFLYVPRGLEAVSRRFHGIEPAAAGIDHNLPAWFVPVDRQRHALVQ